MENDIITLFIRLVGFVERCGMVPSGAPVGRWPKMNLTHFSCNMTTPSDGRKIDLFMDNH